MKWFVIAAAIAAAAPVPAAAQARSEVTGDNPGQQNAVSNQGSTSALGLFSTTPALSNAAHNATNNPQQWNATMDASTTQGVSENYGVDTSSAAVGVSQLLDQSGAAAAPPTDSGAANQGAPHPPRTP